MPQKHPNLNTPGSALAHPDIADDLFRLLVQSVKDYAIFLLDPDGFVISWNEGAQRIKGYAADEIIGRHFSAFYTKDAIDTNYPALELRMAASAGHFEDHGWRVRKDGSLFWADVVITPLFNGAGTLRGFAKVTRDLTERKKADEALRESLGSLARTNRRLTEKSDENEAFVYSVSHDVRAPLINLQGFSQEIQRSCSELRELLRDPQVPENIYESGTRILDGDLAESLRYMQTAVLHLGRMIDALLRLSRIGSVTYKPAIVDVTAAVAHVIEFLHGAIVARGAEIIVEELPPALADTAAIDQVFSNLIVNALNYSDPSRRCRIEIGAGAPADEDRVLYYVKDNGLGIPASGIPTLFRAFNRFHPQVAPGEGIGLATVRRIVDRLQGNIRVESTVGAGTTFYIELPSPQKGVS